MIRIKLIIIILLLSGSSSNIVGSWTRTVTPFTSTFKFHSDGSGWLCLTKKGYSKRERLTYDGSTIYIKDKEIAIKFIAGGFLVIGDSESNREDYVFYRSRVGKCR